MFSQSVHGLSELTGVLRADDSREPTPWHVICQWSSRFHLFECVSWYTGWLTISIVSFSFVGKIFVSLVVNAQSSAQTSMSCSALWSASVHNSGWNGCCSLKHWSCGTANILVVFAAKSRWRPANAAGNVEAETGTGNTRQLSFLDWNRLSVIQLDVLL